MGYRNYREAAAALEEFLGHLLNPLDRWGRPIMSQEERLAMERRPQNPADMDKPRQGVPQSVHDMNQISCIATDEPLRNTLHDYKLWANWHNKANYKCTNQYGSTEIVTGSRRGTDLGAGTARDIVPYGAEALTLSSKPIPGWGEYPRVTSVRRYPFHPLDSDVEELRQWYRKRSLQPGKRSPR